MAPSRLILVALALIAGASGFILVRALRNPNPDQSPGEPPNQVPAEPVEIETPQPRMLDERAARSMLDKESPKRASSNLFTLLLPFLDEDRIHTAIGRCMSSKKVQTTILELLLRSKDPEVMRLCGHFLMWVSDDDVEMVNRIADSLEEASQPERRRALAHALGFNAKHERVRTIAMKILDEGQPELVTEILSGLRLSEVPDEEVSSWRSRLQASAVGGATSTLRARALGALWGDPTAAGTQFLLDRLSNTSEPGEVAAAIDSISCWSHRDEVAVMAPQIVQTLLELARNGNLDLRIRKSAASRVGSIANDFPQIDLDDSDRSLITHLRLLSRTRK